MKTAIIYSTKYGSVDKCANLLKEELGGEVTLYNLKDKKQKPDLSSVDQVVLGGSIHAGQLVAPLKKFCKKNQVLLKSKKLGIFVCCLAPPEKGQEYLEQNFPEELVAGAGARGFFGGELTFAKMNFIERAILKKITGSDQDKSTISPERIRQFAADLNK